MEYSKMYFSGLESNKSSASNFAFLGGLYYPDLSFCWEASLSRSYKQMQGPLVEFNPDCNPITIEHECYYGGILLKHFGHFFLESLSRLSGINIDNKPIYFIVRPGMGVNRLSDLPINSLRLLEYAVGDLSRVKILSEPCVFSNICVSPSEYRVQDVITSNHVHFMQQLGSKFKVNRKYLEAVEFFYNKKVWLSRSSLVDNLIQGECDFEQYLLDNEFLVVKPERMSLEEQIAIYESAALVTGFTGTAFHPILLCENVPGHILHFVRTPKINQNFLNCIKYLSCNSSFEMVYVESKKTLDGTHFLVDYIKASSALKEQGYVASDIFSFNKNNFSKRDYSRELAMADVFSTYNNKNNLDKAIKLAIKLTRG